MSCFDVIVASQKLFSEYLSVMAAIGLDLKTERLWLHFYSRYVWAFCASSSEPTTIVWISRENQSASPHNSGFTALYLCCFKVLKAHRGCNYNIKVWLCADFWCTKTLIWIFEEPRWSRSVLLLSKPLIFPTCGNFAKVWLT